MNIKLQQLRNFLLIIKHGGFRSAASAENKTQAGLSTSIKTLEYNLGIKLFTGDNKATLTPFGKQCLPKVTNFLKHYSDLESFIVNGKQGNQGKIRISCVPSILNKIMPEILSTFTKQYKNVEISLSDNTAENSYKALVLNKVDIAIANRPDFIEENIISIPILSDKLGIVCLRTHPLAQNTNKEKGINWEEVKPYDFIENGTCTLLKNTPAETLLHNKSHTVQSILSLMSVLHLDLGISILPEMAVPENDSKLIWIPIKNIDVTRNICLLYNKDYEDLPQIKSFIKVCSLFTIKQN